jgi:branched-chain amino acid transport system ATP-binding protein
MISEKLLEVSGINVSYGATQVLWDVSFSVARKELVALVGTNGAGKTTSLLTVQGLLKPKSGSVRFNSKDIGGLPAHKITSLGLSLVPEGRRLFTTMTVEENLDLGAFTARARRNIEKNKRDVFELFPILKDRRRQRAGSLSGGEQQMLAVGRGLMSEPEMLMLDEPSLGLAPIIVTRVFEVFEELKERGLTILLVEQNVDASLAMADRAYLLDNGRITFEGSPDQFRTNRSLREAYLGL